MIIQSQLEINKQSDIVIDLIKSENNLEKFHPFCKKNIVNNWPGINSIDELQYYNGDIYTRKFINWIDNVGYDLYISKKNRTLSQDEMETALLDLSVLISNYFAYN